MSADFEDLGLSELRDTAEAATAAQNAERLAEYQQYWGRWSSNVGPRITAELIDTHYGNQQYPEHATVADNWRRALGQVALSHDWSAPYGVEHALEIMFNNLTNERIAGWHTLDLLREVPVEKRDPTVFTADGMQLVARFMPSFKPVGIQIGQMRQQVLPQKFIDRIDIVEQYDEYGRFRPYPPTINEEIYGWHMSPETLQRINRNQPLLIRGLDYDQGGTPTVFDEDDEPRIRFLGPQKIPIPIIPAKDLFYAGLERVKKRVFDPDLTTMTAIQVSYTPYGAEDVADKTVTIPNPRLPLPFAEPLKFTGDMSAYLHSIREQSWLRKLFWGGTDDYAEIFPVFCDDDAQADFPRTRQILVERLSPLAEIELYPQLAHYLEENTARGKLVLDLIDAN